MLLKLRMLFETILTKQAIFRIFSSKMASCCKIVEIDSSICGSTSCSSITNKHFKPRKKKKSRKFSTLFAVGEKQWLNSFQPKPLTVKNSLAMR